MRGKLFLLSIAVAVAAYFFGPKCVKKFFQSALGQNETVDNVHIRIFTKDNLALYKGDNNGDVYLALAGYVFDVTKGRKHYGPGGGYEFFAGIDGSKAYVTGQFDKDGLTDDISELSPAEVLGLENWKAFYEKDYKLIGKVEGAFFDKDGKELPMMQLYKKKLKQALLEKDLIENDKKLFPPCNSEWSQNSGGRVWCSTRSGGVARDWVGVPRMFYSAGSSQPRCACIRTTGPPSHDPESTNHKNRGDLDNPNLNRYANCEEMSESCPLPQNN
ncbi:neuferricin-like [Biomphalaria glabrata]|uniref:Neuferricin-like n=1 Tax=Biomphalaria glabrata TaxID=6526 RepID=A0A9W3A887_BIOGL|nr:neuferricin-like [Biomphalaria glabrata]